MIRRPHLRTRFRRATLSLRDVRHRKGVRRLRPGASEDYRRYLDVQLERTLSKRENDPGIGARVLIRKVVEAGGLGGSSSILCVGCRNAVELDLLHEAGVGNVVGIDLFSEREDILVMDMHELTFPPGSFDAVYCSHSLEHAYDSTKVMSEIERVARTGSVVAVEVPLGDRRSDADRVEFRDLADLRAAVAPVVGEELWADEQEARTATNAQGTAVARVVFRLADK